MIDIVILTFEPFPFGMAATNRFTSWAKVMVESGYSVKVIILKPTENPENVVNVSTFGNFKGIQYQYLSENTIWYKSNPKLTKFVILSSGYFKLIRQLYRDKPKTVTTYSADFILKVIVLFLKPVFKFKLVVEETEFPKILKRKTNSLFTRIYLSLYRYSDAMLVMTEALKLYYKSLGVKNIIVLPMSVDISRFDGLTHSPKSFRYFIYVGGSGGFIRDGVIDILKGFHLFTEHNHEHLLLIVGPVDQELNHYAEITSFIEQKSLGKRIIITGSKPSPEIPQLLVDSDAIIMAPRMSFATGGFPTKLGEFLSSGRPVICTRVGILAEYLDESNVFVVEPSSPESICHALNNIVFDSELGLKKGLEGKKLVDRYFDVNSYKHLLFSLFFNERSK